VAGYIPRRFTCPQTVTHPSSNHCLPFQTHYPTQPTKTKNYRPTTNSTNPTNPWVNPTHGQLCPILGTCCHLISSTETYFVVENSSNQALRPAGSLCKLPLSLHRRRQEFILGGALCILDALRAPKRVLWRQMPCQSGTLEGDGRLSPQCPLWLRLCKLTVSYEAPLRTSLKRRFTNAQFDRLID